METSFLFLSKIKFSQTYLAIIMISVFVVCHLLTADRRKDLVSNKDIAAYTGWGKGRFIVICIKNNTIFNK